MISCERLTYTTESKTILEDISFEVNRSERIAMLGHNGAGKSTLIDLLIDYIKPTKGKVHYEGQTFYEAKSKIGLCLFDTPLLSGFLKVKELLVWVAKLYKISKNTILKQAESSGLLDFFSKNLSSLSTGERKKIGIFLALFHNPEILILDEPTASLDPFVRTKTWERIIATQAAVLFSTHAWEEAQHWADSILFIHKGRLLIPKISVPQALALLPSEKKLTLPIEIGKLCELAKETGFSYFDRDKYHFIGDTTRLLEEMKDSIKMEYSISPISLEDVYRFLINQSVG